MLPLPITPCPPRPVGRPLPLLTQSWLDLTFVHWPFEPAAVAPLLPAGTEPDTLHGLTYVGLIAFRMHGVGWFGLPGVPYLGAFPETNVRLYSVDSAGRRATVFRSLDAARLLPVLMGRAGFGLKYAWSRMAIGHEDAAGRTNAAAAAGGAAEGETVTYTSSRRWPGPHGAHSRISVRVGEVVEEPTELEHFVTARWGLHTAFLGSTLHIPNAHPRWPLHRATLRECDEDLVTAAGLPQPSGEPASVLYSPGVDVRFGRPARTARRPVA